MERTIKGHQYVVRCGDDYFTGEPHPYSWGSISEASIFNDRATAHRVKAEVMSFKPTKVTKIVVVTKQFESNVEAIH